jgi:hypothetical protein
VAATFGAVPAAQAIPNTCPTTEADAGTVVISAPAAASTVSGAVIVRGHASTPTKTFGRVELFLGESLKDFQVVDPPQAGVDFALHVDLGATPAGKATLSVVACGGAPGAAVRGIASIDVTVAASAAEPAPPVPLTTVRAADTSSGPGRLWVGAAFGLAGLVGLIAAVRLNGGGGREATVPTGAVRPSGRARRGPAAAPPRPSPAPLPRVVWSRAPKDWGGPAGGARRPAPTDGPGDGLGERSSGGLGAAATSPGRLGRQNGGEAPASSPPGPPTAGTGRPTAAEQGASPAGSPTGRTGRPTVPEDGADGSPTGGGGTAPPG